MHVEATKSVPSLCFNKGARVSDRGGGQTFGQNPDILGGHHFLRNPEVLNDRTFLNKIFPAAGGHLKIEDNRKIYKKCQFL